MGILSSLLTFACPIPPLHGKHHGLEGAQQADAYRCGERQSDQNEEPNRRAKG
jgi:hypothetical protein